MQQGFFFPGVNPPPTGTNVPLLDLRAGTPGTPINVRYDTTWPSEVPELRVGETLVKPKNGLPQIAGQSSVEILYQQSLQTQGRTNVQLIDPIRIRSVPLAQLPADVETRNRAGNLYFPTLPPYLKAVSAMTRSLAGCGSPANLSSHPRANRISCSTYFLHATGFSRRIIDRRGLAGCRCDSCGAGDKCRSGTGELHGFDSLALTGGNAEGTGYVTVAFGNSTNLSAPAEPISLSVIRVSCPLYRGELKVIESPNPLAEQLTLRHSGDFAGRSGDFEFEWRTLPPVDGLPSPEPPAQWAPFQPSPITGIGAVDITISGPVSTR
jgi:hypothetical protein